MRRTPAIKTTTKKNWCLRFQNTETLSSLLYSFLHRRKWNLYMKTYLSLPRLSGQMANTMISVGNEQNRSTKKFVLQEKGIVVSTIYLLQNNLVLSAGLIMWIGAVKRFESWRSLRQRASTRNVSFRISLRWPIHIFNSFDKIKLPCNTPQRRSTTVSLKTYPSVYMFIN